MFPYLDTSAFTYAFMDFRGYGAASALAGEYSIKEMGLDMVATADHLGWKEFHLLGNSMGGQAAQCAAACFPERVQSLALLSSVPAQGFPLDEETMAFFRQAASDASVRAQIASTVTGGRYSQHFAQWMSRLSAATASSQIIDSYLTAWTSNNIEGEVQGCDRPVKAFVGEYDPVLTKSVTEQTVGKNFLNCEIEVIRNCGHFAPVETPCFTAAAVEAFFKMVSDRRSIFHD
jgi:pimeloyl-ACP methyl ester carboxylesterase